MPPLVLLLFFPLLLSASRPGPEGVDEKNQVNLLPHHPTDTWSSFNRFLNAERGSHVIGISELKLYLNQFGYLPNPNPAGNFSDAYDARLESAVSLYQSNHGLPITGKLNNLTLTQIMSPRCGVKDSDPTRSVQRFAFFPGEPRWPGSRPITLTYALSPVYSVDYIDRAMIKAILRRAFERWARVIPVTFVEAMEYAEADVKMGFYAGDHGDGEPFDGVLGVLAHAFSPESGRLHLDAAERWAVDFEVEESRAAVDLESVVTHEIGHVLGLGHSAVREAVMYPSLSPRTRKVELRVDDVEGVQALYGSNPNFKFSSLLESDTSSSPMSSSRSWVVWRNFIGIWVVVVVVCV